VKHSGAALDAVPRETSGRLLTYAELLLRWNAKINLISRRDEAQLLSRHIEDALQLVSLIPGGIAAGIDLGSGAGVPGLVVAIATGVHFDLVDSDKRKAAFLREAARVTNAPVTVHNARVEKLALPPAKLVTARAFAPLRRLLDLAHPLVATGGIFLLPKGKNVDAELTDARSRWNMQVEKFPSKTDPGATILRLSEVTRV